MTVPELAADIAAYRRAYNNFIHSEIAWLML
jgi:hypothetical protein